MARQRKKGSDTSFNNYGLKPEEDKQLMELLREKDLSGRQLVKALLRQWMKEGGHGVLRYSTK